jgi:hypothetical protein
VCQQSLYVRQGSGKAKKVIEKMSALYNELLSSNLPKLHLNNAVKCFSTAVLDYLPDLLHPPLQKVIECLSEAHLHFPNSHIVFFVLSRLFCFHFDVTQSSGNYDSTMVLFDEIIASHSLADSSSQYSWG